MNLCFIYFILSKREKQIQLVTVIMADITGTTDKADSSSHSTDIQQQQQQQLAPRGESSSDSGNSANTPVSFWDFFQKLDDVNWCRNPSLVKE